MVRTRASTASEAQQSQRLQQAESAKPKLAVTKRKRDTADDDGVKVVATSTKKPVKRARTKLRECDICAEEIAPTVKSFPKVSTCQHDQTVCSNCYATQIRANVEHDPTAGWTACTCPSCAQRISPDEAQLLVRRKGLTELNKRIRDAKATLAHDFLWCPAPGCGYGQKHPLTLSPFVTCRKCKSKICFNHQILWHEGQTCQQHDATREIDEDTKKNMDEIRRTTKPCPFCKMRIKKEGGCNHMTCTRCKKHWQWNTVPFDGEDRGTGAEVAGGRETAPGLFGEARENVNLVNQFLNDGVGRVTQAVQAVFPPVRPVQQPRRVLPAAGTTMDVVVNTFQQGAELFIDWLMGTTPPAAADAPVRPRPQASPRPVRVRTPMGPTRRSHRLRALTEGRLTVDLTQDDGLDHLGTEIVDLTHLE